MMRRLPIHEYFWSIDVDADFSSTSWLGDWGSFGKSTLPVESLQWMDRERGRTMLGGGGVEEQWVSSGTMKEVG